MQYIGNDGPLYDRLALRDIYLMTDTKKALVSIEEVFKDMMLYLSTNDISYDQLSICPFFSVFVDSNFVDKENGAITDKQAVLNDYVGISFGKGYFYFEGNRLPFAPELMANFNSEIFYVSFSDFVVGLKEMGYDFDWISNFNDIKKQTGSHSVAVGRIDVSFTKNIVKKK